MRWKEADSSVWSEWTDVPGGPEARWHTVSGLTPGRLYAFEVRAANSTGAGPAGQVTGAPEPDSRALEAPCRPPDSLAEPSEAHNGNVWARTELGTHELSTTSGPAMYLGWFIDDMPTAGSVDFKMCRPIFPGSRRYEIADVVRMPSAFGAFGELFQENGYAAALDGLAIGAQYWVQAAHQPASDGAAEVQVTPWIPSDPPRRVGWENEREDRVPSLFAQERRRIGYESFPGLFDTGGLFHQPAAPAAVSATESSPGRVSLRWEPSATGGLVQRWEYRLAKGATGRWHQWRTMPGDVDRLTHIVDGLEPSERYTFKVRGVNRDHAGESLADSLELSSQPPSGCSEAVGSTAEGSAVCLGGGRFRFEATWESQHDGRRGSGQMRRLTESTGLATFFNADNVELVFKVLDGTEANGNHWVFYGGMTDLGYTLTVTDTQTGEVKSYRNEPGTTCGGGDTTAFGAAGASSATAGGFGSIGLFSARKATPWARSVQAALGCPGDALCLAGGRFEATVEYTNPATGLVVSGRPLLGTDNTGYMTFFSPDNVELAIKALDGRAFNESYWVFATGLTDVDYTITVRDTFGGGVETYSSQDAGQFCTIQDLDAFPQ